MYAFVMPQERDLSKFQGIMAEKTFTFNLVMRYNKETR